MELTEKLENLDDLFCASGVSTSNYGVVGRSLLSDPVLHELTAVRKVRENSFEGDFRRHYFNTYGPKELSVELIEHFHSLCQRDSQPSGSMPKRWRELGRRAGVSECDLMARFIGGVASREIYRAIWLQEPPPLAEAHKLAQKAISAEENIQERRQLHTGVTKQVKNDVTQSLEALA
ncbi:hypothetical protein T4A_7917 [Trichinella pseudospiralis]|nr:hypothetical protein T4A_7917 [Trichinella pseudospiralis]